MCGVVGEPLDAGVQGEGKMSPHDIGDAIVVVVLVIVFTVASGLAKLASSPTSIIAVLLTGILFALWDLKR